MSSVTYDEMLRDSFSLLRECFELESQASELGKAEVSVFVNHFTKLYVNYARIYLMLEECYDQILQPQKRRDLRPILVSVIGRLTEVYGLVVGFNKAEHPSFVDICVDLKILPEQLDLRAPRFYVEEQSARLKHLTMLINELHSFYEVPSAPLFAESSDLVEEPMKDLNEACSIIQRAERGRQARQKFSYTKVIRAEEEAEQRALAYGDEEVDPDEAALMIQKTFRGMLGRKVVKQMREEEAMFVGMRVAPNPVGKKMVDDLERGTKERKMIQRENELALELMKDPLKEKMKESLVPTLKPQWHDEVMQHIYMKHVHTGEYDVIQSKEDGGSIAYMQHEDPVYQRELAEKMKAEGGDEDNGGAKKGKKKKTEKKKKAKKGKGKGKGGDDDEETKDVTLPASQFTPLLAENVTRFVGVWESRPKPPSMRQPVDEDMLMEEIRDSVEKEVKMEVDDDIRKEVANLRKAAAEKEKPVKKDESNTKDEISDDDKMLAYLVDIGVVKKFPTLQIPEYAGKHTYLSSVLAERGVVPEPSFAEVRNSAILYGVLAHGMKEVSEKLDKSFFTKGILFYGPKGSGKKMLAHGIASATGSLFFDISPANLVGKIDNKDAGKIAARAFKAAKTFGPSIVFIGDADDAIRLEKKAKGKTKGSDKTPASVLGGKMKKDLLAKAKDVEPADQILILGTCNSPGMLDLKSAKGVFSRFIYCPRPDYGTRLFLWKMFIEKKRIELEDVKYQVLAQVSEGYTTKTIKSVVEEVLTERRLRGKTHAAFDVREFVGALGRRDPIWMDDYVEFEKLNDKLDPPFCRKKPPEAVKEDDDDDAKKKKKKKKGKK